MVNALVTDEDFAALQGVSVGEDEKVLDATSARGVLDVLLETEALTSEVQEQGLELDSGDAAAQFVRQEQDRGPSARMTCPQTRKVLERYFVSRSRSSSRTASRCARSDRADLRYIYDELAVDGAVGADVSDAGGRSAHG